MKWFWNWGGECFGYQRGNSLFTHHGIEAGRFHGNEIYGADGRYLGEVMNDNRLIRHQAKELYRQGAFTPARAAAFISYAGYVGYVMYMGYEDFPSPDIFSG